MVVGFGDPGVHTIHQYDTSRANTVISYIGRKVLVLLSLRDLIKGMVV